MAEEKKTEREVFTCPVGRFFMGMEKSCRGESKFFEHMNRSGMEFLKAIRTLLDKNIERMESACRTPEEKKATRIKIE